MKFTKEQKELLALLPNKIRKSDELTDSAKLVLANIIFGFGMDKAKENGYVYKSDDDMANDCGISKSTVGVAVRQLEINNHIEVKRGKRGKRGEASEYRLTEKSNLKSNFQIAEKSNFQVFENELIKLKNEIIELKIELSKSNLKSNTDTDIDTDIINIDKTLYTIGPSTGTENNIKKTLDGIGPSTGLKKSNKESKNNFLNEEGENEMSDNGAIEENGKKSEMEMSEQQKENETSLPTADKENMDEKNETDNLNKPQSEENKKESLEAAAAPSEDKYARWRNKRGQIEVTRGGGKYTFVYDSPEEFIEEIKHKLDVAKTSLLKTDILNHWGSQYEGMLNELKSLKIFDAEEYANYRKYVLKPWWEATKQYFPKGWEKCLKRYKDKLDEIKKI